MFRFYSKANSANRVSIAAEHSDGMLKIATSCCSNNDSFTRKRGRMIAEARLVKGKIHTEIPMETCTGKDFYEVAVKVADHVAKTKKVY